MKIKSVQSLAVGEGHTYSADDNPAEIINIDDSSDESEVDVTEPISWSAAPRLAGALQSLSQNPDVANVLLPADSGVNSIDENSQDEVSASSPESPESENTEQVTDGPASPDRENNVNEIEPPQSPNYSPVVIPFIIPTSPVHDADGDTFNAPTIPDYNDDDNFLGAPTSPDYNAAGNFLYVPTIPDYNEDDNFLGAPTSPDYNVAGNPFDSSAIPDGEESVTVLESPESPDPASHQAAGSSMMVRIEGQDGDGASLTPDNPGILALRSQSEAALRAQSEAEGVSSLGVHSTQATGSVECDGEDWEADSEPNPPFPEHNNSLDYAGILALRAQNKAEVDSSRSVKPGQAAGSAQGEAEAYPPLPVFEHVTITRCSLDTRNIAAVNWPNGNKTVGINSGCYNCNGNHRVSGCPEQINRVVVKLRRQADKRNQKQRYFKDAPPQSKYGQFKPGKISNQLRSAMDIRRNELPDFIYKMRIHGYPPGYLEQAAQSASCIKNGGDSARQPQYQGNQSTSIRNGLVKYPGFTTPAPKGLMDYGNRYNAPYSNQYTLDNVARNYVNTSIGPAAVAVPNMALTLPKKLVDLRPPIQFSSSCLGYDRPEPFFNPLPKQDHMDRATRHYFGQNISPDRDVVWEVERGGNYNYKVSENLEMLDKSRRAEEAKKKKEQIAPNPPLRKKRCRSPSLLDPPGFPDSEDSLDFNWSQNTVTGNKVPTSTSSTVISSPDDDDCTIIGIEPKAPKLPLATIVIDSDDDAQAKESQPVYLPNPLYKKPKLMTNEQLQSDTGARSAKSKEWGDFLAEYNIIPENTGGQNSIDDEIQYMEAVTPKKKTKLLNPRSTGGVSTRQSQIRTANENECQRNRDNRLNALSKDEAKFNRYNDLPPMDNSSRGLSRFHTTVIGSSGELRLVMFEDPEKKKTNEVTAKKACDDNQSAVVGSSEELGLMRSEAPEQKKTNEVTAKKAFDDNQNQSDVVGSSGDLGLVRFEDPEKQNTSKVAAEQASDDDDDDDDDIQIIE